MSDDRSKKGFRPLADPAAGILDPVLRKRAGITIELVQAWEEVVGSALGAQSRPLKLLWPRRAHEDDPFQPATLVVACQGFTAMRIQHETGEIISRVNAFLGFAAVGRIKIEQKPIEQPVAKRRSLPPIDAATADKVSRSVEPIEDDGLREALQRLGQSIHAEKMKR
ncbi:MAG TPA: DciA family protein [Phyllobacterium sp.]|nr:DciA family protein [Phyllobacterium sp.]